MAQVVPVSVSVDGGLGTLLIDNPPLNVFTIPVMEEAVAALRRLEDDPAVKVIVVRTGGDKAFSAGVDVADHTPEKMEHMLGIFDELCLGVHRAPKPTVAVVQGMALGGGCELAACCDLVVASDTATFGQPEIKVGVFPIIGVALFAEIMGPKAANEMLLSGATYSAEEARAMGLVNRVVPHAELQAEAEAYLGRLLRNSGVVMRHTKRAILACADAGRGGALQAAGAIYVNDLMTTHDANEGLQAFLEKRRPVWKEV